MKAVEFSGFHVLNLEVASASLVQALAALIAACLLVLPAHAQMFLVRQSDFSKCLCRSQAESFHIKERHPRIHGILHNAATIDGS